MNNQAVNSLLRMRKTKNATFSNKIRKRKKVILYELLPPPKNLSVSDIDVSFGLFSSILKDFPVDAVNIPEVREETRSGTRDSSEIIKMEPRTVCRYLQEHGIYNLIINRPIVYLKWDEQEKWLRETHLQNGISQIIIVGGESSKIIYPGITVIEASKKISRLFPNLLLGGITIPSRKNEAQRVSQKAKSGIEFFTTQILYESSAIKKFLKDYWEICQEKEINPKTIFLSFAPVAAKSDITLLQWLGVEFPSDYLKLLTTGWLGMTWRSFELCQRILDEISIFLEDHSIRIPIGLNIEHVSRHNFESSFLLLERLQEAYYAIRNVENRYSIYD